MTKKTSLLLTGLFAVSGILPCHAEYKFIDHLGTWQQRQNIFDKWEKQIRNRLNGTALKWDDTTIEMFNKYRPKTQDFQNDIKDFNKEASDATGETITLPIDGTGLSEISDKADEVKKKVLSGRSFEDMQENIETINELIKDLTDKIQVARTKDIDISNFARH